MNVNIERDESDEITKAFSADKIVSEFIADIEKIRDELIFLLGKLVETYSSVDAHIEDCSPCVRIQLKCVMKSLQDISSAELMKKWKT